MQSNCQTCRVCRRIITWCCASEAESNPYWVVWHVGWYDAEWVATSGDFFSDPIKAVQCLKT
jgi:hypothetical protein